MTKRHLWLVGGFCLVVLVGLCLFLSTATRSMHDARTFHAAVLLPSGEVLVLGGQNSPNRLIDPDSALAGWINDHVIRLGLLWKDTELPLKSCEIFDPKTRRWTVVESLHRDQNASSAFVLPNGTVLEMNTPLGSSELYEKGHWTEIGSLSPNYYSAVLLPHGEVLAVAASPAPSFLYHPGNRTWTKAGICNEPDEFAATLLGNGKVLVAGGKVRGTYSASRGLTVVPDAQVSSELYDPVTGTWKKTANLLEARADFCLVTLSDGSALAVGGVGTYYRMAECEVFDPKTETWKQTGDLNAKDIFYQVAVRLADGRVLAMGSSHDDGSCELYDPITGRWKKTGQMLEHRMAFTATLLQDGQVLVIGGFRGRYDCYVNFSSCELYDPKTETWSRL